MSRSILFCTILAVAVAVLCALPGCIIPTEDAPALQARSLAAAVSDTQVLCLEGGWSTAEADAILAVAAEWNAAADATVFASGDAVDCVPIIREPGLAEGRRLATTPWPHDSVRVWPASIQQDGRVDLTLTVLHELGHVLGIYYHTETGLMSPTGSGAACIDAVALQAACAAVTCGPGAAPTC